ncbi:MAG: sulfite exporter TauE/SafE family protein [Rhodospirillales bacterium]|nr:sulfite exporter TauE/SafE family protein [Rhodospirillales bacterium]
MTLEYFFILAVIAVLSVVQSLFGMGILIFGTPTLLLMGYDFITALGFLLPASFAISLLQVLVAKTNKAPISRYLYLLCLPGIAAGLWLAEASPLASWTNILIGITLLASALVRFWAPSQKLLSGLLEKHSPTYHLIMGLTHGLTNLGGAFLAILASGTSTDKEIIRGTIAHYYLAFSTVQMAFLAVFMGHGDILLANLPAAAVSAVVYLLIGKRIFSRTSSPAYNIALSVFIAAYGAIILLKFVP